MAITITKTENGRTKVTIESISHYFGDINILPHPIEAKIIMFGTNANGWNGDTLNIDYTDISSPVVTSREDAMEKINLLVGNSAGIQEFIIGEAEGGSIEVTNFDLIGVWNVYSDGILLDSASYSNEGNVITFVPAIDEGKKITVIKIG